MIRFLGRWIFRVAGTFIILPATLLFVRIALLPPDILPPYVLGLMMIVAVCGMALGFLLVKFAPKPGPPMAGHGRGRRHH